jgi:deazaflavin-dependent oxidoreductase (nitroreductase family)
MPFLILLTPLLVVILLAVVNYQRLRQARGMRAGDPAVIDQKRRVNKRFNNRLVMSIGRAGKPHSLFALVEHTGRKSGRQYVTPVRLVQHGDAFIIPLTYGERADWYRNLLTAGRMTIHWQGKPYPVGQPERVEVSLAARDFPLVSRFLFWLDGVPAFVRVKVWKA